MERKFKNIDLEKLSKYFSLKKLDELEEGEKGCFILAKESDDTILTEDKKARNEADKEGLKVAGIYAFLLDCKNRKIISQTEIKKNNPRLERKRLL